jgi:hypothetical protein
MQMLNCSTCLRSNDCDLLLTWFHVKTVTGWSVLKFECACSQYFIHMLDCVTEDNLVIPQHESCIFMVYLSYSLLNQIQKIKKLFDQQI